MPKRQGLLNADERRVSQCVVELFSVGLKFCFLVYFPNFYAQKPESNGHYWANDVKKTVGHISHGRYAEYAGLCGAAGIPGDEYGGYGGRVFEGAAEVFRGEVSFFETLGVHASGHYNGEVLV